MTTYLQKAKRGRDSLCLSLLIRWNTHTPWITTSTIWTYGNQRHFFIWIPILGHVLVHSVDKAHVLVVTVELIWLLFLNISFFNFVPTPNKSLRFTSSRRSYVNRTAIVLTKHCQSYIFCQSYFFAWCALFKVATFLFFAAVCSQWCAFA